MRNAKKVIMFGLVIILLLSIASFSQAVNAQRLKPKKLQSNIKPYPLPLPDLIASGFTGEFIDDWTILLTIVSVKNNGREDITIPFQVSFYGLRGNIIKTELGTVDIPSLAAGEMVSVEIIIQLEEDQPYFERYCFMADSNRDVLESNEFNNWAWWRHLLDIKAASFSLPI